MDKPPVIVSARPPKPRRAKPAAPLLVKSIVHAPGRLTWSRKVFQRELQRRIREGKGGDPE